ncbi:hypothetical protein NUACC26_043170 [Scytonema sp. NUACC26]
MSLLKKVSTKYKRNERLRHIGLYLFAFVPWTIVLGLLGWSYYDSKQTENQE